MLVNCTISVTSNYNVKLETLPNKRNCYWLQTSLNFFMPEEESSTKGVDFSGLETNMFLTKLRQ